MYIHKEGNDTITITFLVLIWLNFLSKFFLPGWAFYILLSVSIVFFVFILSFFRNPVRKIKPLKENEINCPADGKIVVIEDTEEKEYFRDKRKMVSIFMSPLNVHVNRNPVSGEVKYVRYHPGTYLAAWHPKASEENERTTIVYATKGKEILMRQVAGALARRIMFYLEEGHEARAGDDMGFIKFGSRVDLFLPLNCEVKVKVGQKVRGNIDVIASI